MKNTGKVLEAWEAAQGLSRSVNQAAAGASFDGKPKLRKRLERTAACIVTNVAEGFQSYTTVPIRQYLVRAERYVGKLREHLFEALSDGCLSEEQFQGLQEQCANCKEQVTGYLEELWSGNPTGRAVRPTQEGLRR
jgi:four helix bundle protein